MARRGVTFLEGVAEPPPGRRQGSRPAPAPLPSGFWRLSALLGDRPELRRVGDHVVVVVMMVMMVVSGCGVRRAREREERQERHTPARYAQSCPWHCQTHPLRVGPATREVHLLCGVRHLAPALD